jgi:virulence factor Mce-like protein
MLVLTSCGWHGVNSLPLPGAPGRVSGATRYVVEMANVGSLESNSPVMIDDVAIGSVGTITVRDWHADVEVLVKPGVVVPANVVATVGQTSLLGSSHLQLNTPIGVAAAGALAPGSTVGLNASSTYPSTEQTLASLSVVVNGGGLGQFGDIIHNFNLALNGRQDAIRDLISRLDTFVGTFDDQRDDIVASIQALNRLAGTFAAQRDVLTEALHKLPPALDVLVRQRPRITTALEKLRVFSDTTTGVISDVQTNLVQNLQHLEPTIRALADVGIDLNKAIAFASTFPYGQRAIDNAIRGDYINESIVFDFTRPRFKKELFLGTRIGDPNAQIQAAVGDPGYAEQTGDPLGVGVAPAPAPGEVAVPSPSQSPAPPPPAGQGGR